MHRAAPVLLVAALSFGAAQASVQVQVSKTVDALMRADKECLDYGASHM